MNKKKRISAKEKGTLVLRILRGSLIEEVSREAGVSVAVLSQWREQFIESGNNGFKRNPQESLEHRYEQIVGRQHMEIELLKKKNNFIRGIRECSSKQ